MNFFQKCECIRSCYLLTSSNLLKKSSRKTSFFVMEKVLSQVHISSYYCNVVIKIFEKYLLRSSVLEMNFQKLFVSILIQDFNHKFQNTFFEEQSHQLCLILIVSYPSYILVDIDFTVSFIQKNLNKQLNNCYFDPPKLV